MKRNKDKIPVLKNILFALKLVWEADKKMIISAFVTEIANNVLSMYVQNILFLKVLLSIIDGKAEFKTYFISLLCLYVQSSGRKIPENRNGII